MSLQTAFILRAKNIRAQSALWSVGMLCLIAVTTAAFVKTWRLHSLAVAEISQSGSQPTGNPVVIANFTRFGFEPNTIKIPAGRCFIAIRNLVGKDQLDLQIKNSNNAAVLFADRQIKGKSHWEKSLEFGVGEYVITETEFPGRELKLSVVPSNSQ